MFGPRWQLLLGAVVAVLLIACANVANLLLVRARARAAEVAVRAALGAGRSRLLRQLLTESLLLALAGGAFGVLLAVWGVEALRAIGPSSVPRIDAIDVDSQTLVFALALAATTALVFGLAPALWLARQSPASLLRQGAAGRTGPARGSGRFAILVTEAALSAMLMLGAGLMVLSLTRMSRVEPGFATSDVAAFRLSLPAAKYSNEHAVAFMAALRDRVAELPGVEDASVFAAPPLGQSILHGSFLRLDRPEPPPGQQPAALYRIAAPHTFDVLRIPVISGRAFQSEDRQGTLPVAMISRSAAERYFPDTDPVGMRIDVQISAGFAEDRPRTIIGVFEDLRSVQITERPQPELWIPHAQSGARFPNLLFRINGDPADALGRARDALRSLDPDLPVIRPRMLASSIDEQLAPSRFYMLLLALFAALAVTLAAVGIYGVVAFAVAQRTREIGVRIALGARSTEVVRLVVWHGLQPATLGILIGTAAAVAGARFIAGLLFEMMPLDPIALGVATTALLALVSIIACGAPAIRATRVPPATALTAD